MKQVNKQQLWQLLPDSHKDFAKLLIKSGFSVKAVRFMDEWCWV